MADSVLIVTNLAKCVQQNKSERIVKAVVLHRNSYRFALQRLSVCTANRLELDVKTYRFTTIEHYFDVK